MHKRSAESGDTLVIPRLGLDALGAAKPLLTSMKKAALYGFSDNAGVMAFGKELRADAKKLSLKMPFGRKVGARPVLSKAAKRLLKESGDLRHLKENRCVLSANTAEIFR